MLMRFEPLREFRVTSGAGPPLGQALPLDAYRRGDSFYVHVDVPGIDPDQVEVVVEHDTLTITAARLWEQRDGDQVLAVERPEGEFVRHLMLGKGLEADRIEAGIDRGVLTIRIPVAPEGQTRRIEVAHLGRDREGGVRTVERDVAPGNER